MESVLAGSNGDGGIQLRPDGGGASSSAGEWLAVATAGWHQFPTAMGSRSMYFLLLISIFGLFHFTFGLSILVLVEFIIVGQ